MAIKFSKLPIWLIVLLVLMLALLGIVLVILTVAAFNGLEGFASLIMIIVMILVVIVWPLKHKEKASFKGIIGGAIIFLAFMGGIFDQTGNRIMNMPVEQCYCEKGEQLKRIITHSSRGGKSFNSNEFYCENIVTKKMRNISAFGLIGIRMLEYLMIGIILIYIQRLMWKTFYSNQHNEKDKDSQDENKSNTVFHDDNIVITNESPSFRRIIRINIKKK